MIYQFGDAYIHEDGRGATKDEILAFQQRQAASELARERKAMDGEREDVEDTDIPHDN